MKDLAFSVTTGESICSATNSVLCAHQHNLGATHRPSHVGTEPARAAGEMRGDEGRWEGDPADLLEGQLVGQRLDRLLENRVDLR